MDFEPLRWVTMHPALVHFPLGILPFAALAYVVAAARRSRPWTFVGDVALALGTLALLVAAAFGIVSWLLLAWPGGLDPWRWVHLGAGVGAGVLALTLTIVRLTRMRRAPIAGAGTAASMAVVAGLVLFVGWVGGEILVFHGGMAVKAAGNGALAPAGERDAHPPRDLLHAMHRLRGAYGSATATMASAIVEHPHGEDFTTLARDARKMHDVGAWIVEHGAEGAEDEEEAEHLTDMASRFVGHASDLEHAASTQQLSLAADRLGVIQADCAECHEHTRWEEEEHAHGPHVASGEHAHAHE